MTGEERRELEKQVERMNDARVLAENKSWQRIREYIAEFAEVQMHSFPQCKTWDEHCVLRGKVENANDMVMMCEDLIEIGQKALEALQVSEEK